MAIMAPYLLPDLAEPDGTNFRTSSRCYKDMHGRISEGTWAPSPGIVQASALLDPSRRSVPLHISSLRRLILNPRPHGGEVLVERTVVPDKN